MRAAKWIVVAAAAIAAGWWISNKLVVHQRSW